MRTLLGMQYGGNVPQQYPRQQIPPQQFQEGGISSGLAFLKRGKKRKAAYDEAKIRERTLGERMGWSRTFGTALGVGGGLLAAALAPATGGLSLLAPAFGTAAGKYFGSKLGYGKDEEYDDMMYGEEAGFEDIAGAGESYEGQMGQGALTSGLIAGLTAGFAPGGGIYGKVAGKLRPTDVAGATASLGGVGTSLGLSPPPTLGTSAVPGAPGSLATGALTGTKTGLDVIPETLGNIPSVPSGASLSGDRLQLEAARSLLESQSSLKESIGRFDKMIDSPYYKEVMGGAGELAPEIATGAADPTSSALAPVEFGRWGANREQYQPLINQFFQQYSPTQRSAENWMSMFNQPEQFAGFRGGGMVRQTPRTLLSLIG